MKKIVSYLFIFVIVIVSSSAIAGDMNVTGFVGKDYYHKGNNPDKSTETEYKILVTMENMGKENISYDKSIAIIMPQFGDPLSISMTMEKAVSIAKGEKKSIILHTEGHTADLLKNAGDRPMLLFIFLLQNDKKIVSGLHVAHLPLITDVPHIRGKQQKKIIPLEFMEITKDMLINPSPTERDREVERDEIPTVPQSRFHAL
jgi:hypothetical protein